MLSGLGCWCGLFWGGFFDCFECGGGGGGVVIAGRGHCLLNGASTEDCVDTVVSVSCIA